MRWTLLILSGLLLAGLVFGGCGSEKSDLVGPESGDISAVGVDKRPAAPTIPPELPVPVMDEDYLRILGVILDIPNDNAYWEKHEFYLSDDARESEVVLEANGWGNNASVKVKIENAILPPNADFSKPFTVLVPSGPNNFGSVTVFKFLDKPKDVDISVTFKSELFDYPEAGEPQVLFTYRYAHDYPSDIDIYDFRGMAYEEQNQEVTFYLTIDKDDKTEGATYAGGHPQGLD